MEQKNRVKEACIVAIGLVAGLIALGCCLKNGMDNFTNRDRRVTVKGLAEQEVEADKVTWPIQTKEIGNDLPALYSKINATTAAIRQFLVKNGVKESEISVNAPTVIDLNAERYGENNRNYRYNITSTITVVSNNVKLVRSIIARQGELLQQGIAIVDGGYEAPIRYEFVAFKEMKPKMMREAIENAELTAQQFAENSHSQLNKIISADQGQFSIDDRDENTLHIKKVRVVTTITYSLKD
ncbi:MAG: SIMPL domain-containing protein [Bacteroidaceae bacterium]|nr:SIMPL domain-containing protein [Bacteroidaceae bacterium]